MKPKVIYICHPLSGDLEGNIQKVKEICIKIMQEETGVFPIAPQIYMTQFMNDENEEDRNLALDYCMWLVSQCDEVWVYGDRISHGMGLEITEATDLKIPILIKHPRVASDKGE